MLFPPLTPFADTITKGKKRKKRGMARYFTIVPYIEDLNPTQEYLMGFFLGNNKSKKMTWAKSWLAKRFDISRGTLDKYLNEMVEKGYITYTAKRNCNTKFALGEKGKELFSSLFTHAKQAKKSDTKKQCDSGTDAITPQDYLQQVEDKRKKAINF